MEKDVTVKPWTATTHQNTLADSYEAGRTSGRRVRESADGPLCGVIVYFSLMHEPNALLRGVREAVGLDVPLIGASTQGIVARDCYEEGGFYCGVLAFAGALSITVDHVLDIHVDTFAKGARLGRAARQASAGGSSLSVMLYDPLCGVNIRRCVNGFDSVAEGIPLVGAAASGPFGPMIETFVATGNELLHRGAAVMTVTGPLTVLTAASTGTVASGAILEVTKAEGNRILELNGRPAEKVWGDRIGVSESMNASEGASWAIGVDRGGPGEETWTVLAPFIDSTCKGVTLQADVPEGSKIVFHQRTPEIIFERTRGMVDKLAEQKGRLEIGAMLTFECGARTQPFLGSDAAAKENRIVQNALTNAATPWLGMLAWGEIAPNGASNEFFNYTYPIALICHAGS